MNAAEIFTCPNIRPLGRFHRETAQRAGVLPLFWSGSGMELCFTGTELHVSLEAKFDRLEPWIAVEVNGAPLIRMPLRQGSNKICLFQGLTENVPKRVRLLKETQPMPDEDSGCLWLSGLRWSGGTFLPLPAPACRLEFIGDSLSSGEGVRGAREESDYAAPWFSAAGAFPRLTADLLGADWHVISQSGWGIRSDWSNNPCHALPDWYDRVCGPAAGTINAALGAQEDHDFPSWQPDAVIVNLGTNDAGAMEQPPWKGLDGTIFQQRSTPEDLALLETAAVDFLKKLRRHNPGAKLVWAYGMLGEPLRPCLERAVNRFRRDTGDSNAWYLPLPAVTEETMGARLHPGPACHEAAARTIADFLRQIL